MGTDISVIIPVYNAGEYLKECLESVMKQTKKDLEIIIIDDGSVDGSGKVCDDFADRDQRVRVLHTQNRGLVAARKMGISVSSGEFVGYVDADDWIEADAFEKMFRMLVENDCDMFAGGLYRQFSDKKTAVTNTIKPGIYDRMGIEQEIIPRMLFNGIYYQMGIRPNLVNKLFRRKLIMKEQLDVPELIQVGEDTAVTYSCIMHAERVILSNDIFYHYRQHGGSMTKSKSGMDEVEHLNILYNHLKRKLCIKGYEDILLPQINSYISNMLVQRCLDMFDESGCYFSAFGGITPDSKIAVYGAGNFGRQVYNYAVSKEFHVLWVDEKSDFYQAQGLNVKPVNVLTRKVDIDFVVIAVIDERVAGEVRKNLAARGINEEKLLWINTRYITSARTLYSIGIR